MESFMLCDNLFFARNSYAQGHNQGGLIRATLVSLQMKQKSKLISVTKIEVIGWFILFSQQFGLRQTITTAPDVPWRQKKDFRIRFAIEFFRSEL